ncbi:MAG: Methyltransferase-like protein 7B [Watsoniomyces obsoletus]|nr:MAG: Methyltransferase-like protein 7B [Watsoniomyces obsoletus]
MSSPAMAHSSAGEEETLSRSVQRLTDHLETPALDDRSYRVIRLANKLEVLLVHDPETDKASAAMDVNVGSLSDRDDMPGMAHAVEHLLFMGTEKYPKENAYSQYLTTHSGYSNAYTASTSTNYFFEVGATTEGQERSPFYGALDRFAQFFIGPLFLASSLDRELQAVDSENKKNLQSDVWRLHQLSKSTANPKHPYCHFSTGNLETLRDLPKARGIDVRQEFIGFHEKHYSANRMKLVVLGRESLDELQSWVVELFAGVRNQDLPQNRWDDEQPLTENELLTQTFAKPVMDTRLLVLTFPFLDEEDLYESQPSRYISHLVGHEGPGSILAYIKERGWATELSAGSNPVCPGAAFFDVSIRLTDEGLKVYKEVIKVVFQYIALIREVPPQEWIVNEMKGMAEVDFRFKQKTAASKFTSKISNVMQKPLPRSWLLSGTSLIRKFDPETISKGLDCLRPDNFRMTLISQDLEGLDQREKWYGTEYHMEKIPKDLMDEIIKAGKSTAAGRIPDLHLPHKNAFIPTNFDVEKKEIKTPATAPKLVRNGDGARTWWKKDDTFWVPKGNLFVAIRNPLAGATAANMVRTMLFCELVHDALVEYAYDADIAGLSYELSPQAQGLRVRISGYNDKMSVLLEKVLGTMRSLQIKEDRFTVVKERLLEELQNWDYHEPYHQVGEYTSWLDSENGWINEQCLHELEPVTRADVEQFVPQLLGQVSYEVLANGNLHKQDALEFTKVVERCLKTRPLPPSQWKVWRSLMLPRGSNYTYTRPLKDPSNINHCIEYVCYVGERSDRELRAKLLLFAQTTEEPAFDQLRTKEQLGYVVFTGSRMSATTMGYRVLVQSEQTPDFLEGRIDAFLTNFGNTLSQMTDEEFEGHRRSLIKKRQEKLKNLGQETVRFWSHISSEYLDFELVEHDVTCIEKLSKQDVLEFFEHYIRPGSTTRAKLSVHMQAQATSTTNSPPELSDDQKPAMLTMIEQFLSSYEIPVDADLLRQRFDSVDLAKTSPESMISTLELYLVEDLKVDPTKTASVIDTGRSLMSTAMMKSGMQPTEAGVESEGSKEDNTTADSTGNKVVMIDDVREFKASLAVSAGARPVKPLSEFEELNAKL